jgi:hypothetical protein
VELNLAKPNYRHQKEQARKLRQAEKQNRRLAARGETEGAAAPGSAGSAPEAAVPSAGATAGAES